jgi:alpha-mannosidase
LVLTLKQAEDGDGLVIRLIETQGQAVTATVRLPHLGVKKATRTNLVEKDEAELKATENDITAPVSAFGITTVRLRTKG